tara:strand:- start:203 stop:772 length:570 start_codon:yes stop_codon:yes gene_type:complete
MATTEVVLEVRSKTKRVNVATRQLKILLAEDNRVNQRLITALLDQVGHTIEVAENGANAVEALVDGKYDLVLMDARMPRMNGTEATIEIRKGGGKNANIPIIAVTADAMHENIAKYLESGMNAVATKPIQLAELLETIDDVLKEKIHTWEEIAAPPTPPKASRRAADKDNNEFDALLERMAISSRELEK